MVKGDKQKVPSGLTFIDLFAGCGGFSLGLIILPAVGLGLVVDDTIHMVWGVRRQLRGGHDVREAVTRILSTTGRALILSTLILASGFASLWASPFISNTQLAIFMPMLLILALMFDLVAVPVVLMLAQRRRDRAGPPHRRVDRI